LSVGRADGGRIVEPDCRDTVQRFQFAAQTRRAPSGRKRNIRREQQPVGRPRQSGDFGFVLQQRRLVAHEHVQRRGREREANLFAKQLDRRSVARTVRQSLSARFARPVLQPTHEHLDRRGHVYGTNSIGHVEFVE